MVGWPYREPEKIKAAFEKSSHVIFLKDYGNIVAAGRTADDATYYGL
jgi:hypothetical protein